MDGEISEYLILEGTANELKALVDDRLTEGWVPLGGVAVAANRSALGELECVFAQAMVRSAAYRKSLAVTVPLVATNDTSLTATVSIPTSAASDSVVACPHCHVAIPIKDLRDGSNTCQKCRREFVVEWGG